MPGLVNWTDFNKFNKELMDDDYNHGQRLVAKVKSSSDDGTSVIKVYLRLIGID